MLTTGGFACCLLGTNICKCEVRGRGERGGLACCLLGTCHLNICKCEVRERGERDWQSWRPSWKQPGRKANHDEQNSQNDKLSWYLPLVDLRAVCFVRAIVDICAKCEVLCFVETISTGSGRSHCRVDLARDRSISLIPTRHRTYSHAVPRAPRPYAERAQARIRQVSMPNNGKYLHAHCQQQWAQLQCSCPDILQLKNLTVI
jgi:hypothetical protein